MSYETESLYWMRRRAPLWWHNKSSDLRASAGAVWLAIKSDRLREIADQLSLGEGFDMRIACWPVYRMLCGMSLELIFKALIVAERCEPTHTHNLKQLSKDAGLTYSEDTMAILDVLTESAIWHGRYPVPKSEGEMLLAADREQRTTTRAVGQLGSEGPTIRRYSGALDWNAFDGIWQCASDEFFERYSERGI